MKSLFNRWFVAVLVLFLNVFGARTQVFAQVQPGIVSMNMDLKFHVNSNPVDTLNPTFDVVFKILLSDTLNIKKIHLMAGLSEGSNDVFEVAVKLDDTSNLPSGVTYLRIGNLILVTAKEKTIYSNYYYQAKIEKTSGGFSNPVTYHYN